MENSKYLAHYGIPGQKWGERRFQNEDGSLTSEGKLRYGYTGKVKKATKVETPADRRRRIKQEAMAIRNSRVSNREKARALSKLGDHDSSADYYRKDFVNKRRAAVAGRIGYAVGASVLSNVMNDKVKSGKMTLDQAKKYGSAFSIGKTIVGGYLGTTMLDDLKKHNKEYWSF